MITTIIAALTAEKREGNDFSAELIERIDAHIRDLETLKAWVRDSARLRAEAIDSLVGSTTAPAGAPLPANRVREDDDVAA